jgi:hypothetical protein
VALAVAAGGGYSPEWSPNPPNPAALQSAQGGTCFSQYACFFIYLKEVSISVLPLNYTNGALNYLYAIQKCAAMVTLALF